MIDRFAIDQLRTAESIVAAWDAATLAEDIGMLNSRLYRTTGIAPGEAAKLIHAERFKRNRRG